jgi:hypothetical protein
MPKLNNSVPGKRALNRVRRRPHKSRADVMTTQVTETDINKLSLRLLNDGINVPVVTKPGIAITMKESHTNAFNTNPPWGSLPFLVQIQNQTVSVEEALMAADRCAIAKNEFTARGDYYRAWQFGWRQRMIERVVQGLTKFGLVKV